MTPPRFSIQALAVAVFVLAADCAALRLAMSHSGSGLDLSFALLGSVPTANVLAVVVYRLATRPDSRRPFPVGFAVAGLAATLVWFNLCLKADDLTLFSLNLWLNKVAGHTPFAHGRLSPTSRPTEVIAYATSYFSILMLITSLPLLLSGVIGGHLGRRIAASLGTSTPHEAETAVPPQ